MKSKPHAYDHREVESRWQKAWEKSGLNSPDIHRADKPYYNLMMFPYPSAEGLHVGNMYAFTGSDVFGRLKRLQGHDVFEPIGLDGFGIHSENYALKVGRHPMDHARITQQNFYTQLRKTGSMYDWSKTVETYDPGYYRWTQWIFVEMFKHGLAYRGKATVNWCPSCKTVLADEQVVKKSSPGQKAEKKENEELDKDAVFVCERCGNIVENKLMEQWFFGITAYADRLLENLRTIEWSENVKKAQKVWIGKKTGIEINYRVIRGDNETIGHIQCYTTRPDTNFGATFVVLSPEHKFITHIKRLIDSKKALQIGQYQKQVKNTLRKVKNIGDRAKTGVFTGLYCVNELNGYKMPLYISDFVMEKVGTGAVVGVPGHDKRDYEFAITFHEPIKRVVVASDGKTGPITDISEVQEDEGTMINSDFLNGLPIMQAKEKMIEYLVKKGWGKRVSTYHLRDWLISRQRYWGPPIPMIFCRTCKEQGKSWFTTAEAKREKASVRPGNGLKMEGWYPVPVNELPVVLPKIDDYKPGNDGIAPLAKHKEFYETECPGCYGKAVRETDVSDTFLDSAWYFLRYPSVSRDFNKNADNKSSTTNTTGREGVVTELADDTHDVPVAEDVIKSTQIKNQSKKNTAGTSVKVNTTGQNPWDPAITKKWLPVDMYTGGAEHSVLHLMYSRFITMALHDWGYLHFEEPFTKFYAHGLVIKDGAKMSKSKGNVVNPDEYIETYGADALRLYLMFMGPFSQGGDFRDTAMEGMYRWVGRVWRLVISSDKRTVKPSEAVEAQLSTLIIKVTRDLEARHYNTAIATMMEFTNYVTRASVALDASTVKTFLILLSPFAPHLTEELWQRIHGRVMTNFTVSDSIHTQSWPQAMKVSTKESDVNMIVQVNGKLRAVISMAYQDATDQERVRSLASEHQRVKDHLKGSPKHVIFISGRLINFVV